MSLWKMMQLPEPQRGDVEKWPAEMLSIDHVQQKWHGTNSVLGQTLEYIFTSFCLFSHGKFQTYIRLRASHSGENG